MNTLFFNLFLLILMINLSYSTDVNIDASFDSCSNINLGNIEVNFNECTPTELNFDQNINTEINVTYDFQKLYPRTVYTIHINDVLFGTRFTDKDGYFSLNLSYNSSSSDNFVVSSFFPLGSYDKTEFYEYNNSLPYTWEEHYQKVMDKLVEYNLNTFVPTTKPQNNTEKGWLNATELLYIHDLMKEHEIYSWLNPGNPLNGKWAKVGEDLPYHVVWTHPSIIAYKHGDEQHPNKDQTKYIQKVWAIKNVYSEHPVNTVQLIVYFVNGSENKFFNNDTYYNMQGYGDYGYTRNFTQELWNQTGTDIKMIRVYPFRRTYDLVNWYPEKHFQPFQNITRIVEEIYDSDMPWWFVSQSHGKGKKWTDTGYWDYTYYGKIKKNSYWRFPTYFEFSAMNHVALANGARALISYSFQNNNEGKNEGLFYINLTPNEARDGSYPVEAFSDIAQKVQNSKGILLRHKPSNFTVNVNNSEIYVVDRHDPYLNEKYIYIVNLWTNTSKITNLKLNFSIYAKELIDIYTNNKVTPILLNNSYSLFNLTLNSGEGRFYKIIEQTDCSVLSNISGYCSMILNDFSHVCFSICNVSVNTSINVSINVSTNVSDNSSDNDTDSNVVEVDDSSSSGKRSSSSNSFNIAQIIEKDEEICIPSYEYYNWSDCVNGFQTQFIEDINECEGDLLDTRICMDDFSEEENLVLNAKKLDLIKVDYKRYNSSLDSGYNGIFYVNNKLEENVFLLTDNNSKQEYLGQYYDTIDDKVFYTLRRVDEGIVTILQEEGILDFPIEKDENNWAIYVGFSLIILGLIGYLFFHKKEEN